MKVHILQKNLKTALSYTSKILSTKSQLPILNNALLEAKKGKLYISSTNLETSVTFWIGATIEEEGAITVPARMLSELVSSFVQEKVELSLKKDTLHLACGDSSATLTGVSAEEFPPLPKRGEKEDAKLKSKALFKALQLVLLAASTDEGRPILTGVKMFDQNNKMTLVATDGYRLSVSQTAESLGNKEGFVIPAKTLREIHRLIGEEMEEEIEVYSSRDKNQIIFLFSNAQIATRLIEGEYPAYEKIIPQESASRAQTAVVELTRAVKLAAVYAREAANIVRIKINAQEIEVSANTPQVGENRTTVEAKGEGQEISLALNARFLLDFLQVVDAEEIVIETNDSLKPCVFKLPSDDSYLHIIMPVRVQE